MKKQLLFLALSFLLMPRILAQNWQPIGPVNRTSANGSLCQGAGRLDAIAFDANYSTNKIAYVASPFGGVWQGNWDNVLQKYIWTNVGISTDNVTVSNSANQIPGCGVTDIVADYNNGNTLYAALAYYKLSFAIGVYKYTPANGWQPTGLQFPATSRNRIYRLTMHPTNNSIIYACTDVGVHKTTDGGQTWTLLNINGNTGWFYNLVFDPTNSSVIYAASAEVHKSTDGGITWTQSSSFATMYNTMTTNICNIDVGNDGRVYAGVYLLDPNQVCSSKKKCVKLALLNGPSWVDLPMFPMGSPNNHEWTWDRMTMAAHPSNPNILYMGQEELHRFDYSLGTNGQWNFITSYCDASIHADMHDIAFAPDGSLFVTHDGGLSIATTNILSGNPNLNPSNTNLNTSIVRGFSGTDADDNEYLVGEDDNGNSFTANADPSNFSAITWSGYTTTDGGNKLIDYSNAQIWYDENSSYGPMIRRSTNGNPISVTQAFPAIYQYEYKHFGVMEPLIQDPLQPNIVYKGTNYLSRSTNKGTTSSYIYNHGQCDPSQSAWYTVVTDIAIPKVNPNYIYITTYNNQASGFYPKVLKTTVGSNCPEQSSCSCWTDISPAWPTGLTNQQANELYISSVVASELNPNKVWIGYRYSSYSPAYKIKVFDGAIWQDYSTGLPDGLDVETMVYDRGSNDGVYIGTSSGVYYRDNTMASWVLFSTNDLPRVTISKLQINYNENTIRAGTSGRGIWKSSLYCPANQYFTETGTISQDKFTEASIKVTGSNCTINGGNVKFRGGQSVDLLPGFSATGANGSTFFAYIHGCNTPGSSFRTFNNTTDGEITNAVSEIEKKLNSEIQIHPNPSEGQFNIIRSSEIKCLIQIYDVVGKLIWEKDNIKDKSIEINISKQPEGVYIVKIHNADGKFEVKRIIKN